MLLHLGQRAFQHVLRGFANSLLDGFKRDVVTTVAHLVQQANAVTKTAFPVGGNEFQRRIINFYLLVFGDLFQVSHYLITGNWLKSKALGAAHNCLGHLMTFSSGKDKNGVGRRFLKCLEQSVKRLLGQHMDFINDVDLIFSTCGRNIHPFFQVADFINTTVAGGIDLNNI